MGCLWRAAVRQASARRAGRRGGAHSRDFGRRRRGPHGRRRGASERRGAIGAEHSASARRRTQERALLPPQSGGHRVNLRMVLGALGRIRRRGRRADGAHQSRRQRRRGRARDLASCSSAVPELILSCSSPPFLQTIRRSSSPFFALLARVPCRIIPHSPAIVLLVTLSLTPCCPLAARPGCRQRRVRLSVPGGFPLSPSPTAVSGAAVAAPVSSSTPSVARASSELRRNVFQRAPGRRVGPVPIRLHRRRSRDRMRGCHSICATAVLLVRGRNPDAPTLCPFFPHRPRTSSDTSPSPRPPSRKAAGGRSGSPRKCSPAPQPPTPTAGHPPAERRAGAQRALLPRVTAAAPSATSPRGAAAARTGPRGAPGGIPPAMRALLRRRAAGPAHHSATARRAGSLCHSSPTSPPRMTPRGIRIRTGAAWQSRAGRWSEATLGPVRSALGKGLRLSNGWVGEIGGFFFCFLSFFSHVRAPCWHLGRYAHSLIDAVCSAVW